ncbi:helix-turn-helix domain-containing protein (plasmid) [Microvirga terrae]|nr:helix-turn-helix transcriptional regulator [Microvirga terrae]UVF22847.1 helix-turn-helix domain-containing protein [Microvirga terrae]
MAAQPIRLTPRLCRAARALLGWQQADLSEASGIPKPTVSAFETKDESARMSTMNNKAAIEAFEKAGLEFIPENGGGAGMRFRERRTED